MTEKITRNWIILLACTTILISCNQAPPADEDRSLRMVYTDWSESIALTHLAAVLLEEEMGYNIELKLTDVEDAYSEVANGTADLFADAWLPETHQQYAKEHSGHIEQIGITYPEARTGFLVPAFSEMQTIADLRMYRHPVIGIDEGAGVMQKATKAIQQYNLPLKLTSNTEEEMIKQLEDSIKRRKDIVITGWSPHWIFTRYEVKFLADPDSVFGANEHIYTIARLGIEEGHPNAVRFFERMQLTAKQLNSLVYQVRLSEDPQQGVKNWINENEYTVNHWVKNLKPERVKVM